MFSAKLSLGLVLSLAALTAVVTAVLPGSERDPVTLSLVDGGDESTCGPGPVVVDAFHPDRDNPVEPAWGGTATVHLRSMSRSLNYAIDNWVTAKWVLFEIHEWLVQRDWETWGFEPGLARRWDSEDSLLLKPGLDTTYATTPGRSERAILYGKVTDGGSRWIVEPVSPGNPLPGKIEVPKNQVESVQRGTVTTWHLHEGVKWHDGHPFDADDVLFSWTIYGNPGVDCDSIRDQFQRIVHGEVIDEHTVRFFYAEQYFGMLSSFEGLCVLPRHVYDLSDPDNPDHEPGASAEDQARHINENPHNTQWIGLGAYKLTEFSDQVLVAERFDDYFDPERAGYLDTIRWRHIPSTDGAFQALINGDLDMLYSVTSSNYFGEATRQPEFTDRFYKGYYYTGSFNYTPFNLLRPKFQDVRVRKALVHAFDMEEYRSTIANGLAVLPTGAQFYFGPSYNSDIDPLPYDRDKAEELLAEAGWYDRDGDGVIDKDGIPFEADFLTVANNKAAQLFCQKFQESMEAIGVRVNIVELEATSYYDRVLNKDFDLAGGSWSVDPEEDPEQLWHSRGAAPDVRGSNRASVSDPFIDELIEKGQRELDDKKRWALWRELHAYIYEEVMPYIFRLAPPKKFAMNKNLRGMQCFMIDPGFSIRRWYYPKGTPGTRSTRER